MVEDKQRLLMKSTSLLAEVSHDEAQMRERRETLSFLSFLPRRERPLPAGKKSTCFGCFFWTLTQCQMALMEECIYSKLRKFTISKRGLVKFARLALTRRAIHGSLTLQPLKCIPLVVIDNRERK